jgi:hypothetical protein
MELASLQKGIIWGPHERREEHFTHATAFFQLL